MESVFKINLIHFLSVPRFLSICFLDHWLLDKFNRDSGKRSSQLMDPIIVITVMVCCYSDNCISMFGSSLVAPTKRMFSEKTINCAWMSFLSRKYPSSVDEGRFPSSVDFLSPDSQLIITEEKWFSVKQILVNDEKIQGDIFHYRQLSMYLSSSLNEKSRTRARARRLCSHLQELL